MAEDGYSVKLNIYDRSRGLARQLSTTFLGKAIEAIWHTGVVVYGNEYYFGGGIQHAPSGATPYGPPMRVLDLGVTHVPKELFEEYLQEIGPRYTAEAYSLLSHNCNNFSNEVVQFLVGATVPDYILQLPTEVMNSPMGPLILPMIQQLETTMRSGAVPQAPQFRPPASVARTVASSPSNSGNSVKLDSQATTENAATGPAIVEKKPPVAKDPLGDARSRVQEEITREFATLMASGTLRASEAAALATRKVMDRHRQGNVPMQQG